MLRPTAIGTWVNVPRTRGQSRQVTYACTTTHVHHPACAHVLCVHVLVGTGPRQRRMVKTRWTASSQSGNAIWRDAADGRKDHMSTTRCCSPRQRLHMCMAISLPKLRRQVPQRAKFGSKPQETGRLRQCLRVSHDPAPRSSTA